MFDNNRNIKVGRDINIQVDKRTFENLNDKELKQKKDDSNFILKKESEKKLRKTLNFLIFAILLFLTLYYGLPFVFSKYRNEDNLILNFLSKIIQNEKAILVLSGLASFVTILNPLSDLWKSNDIEKKQYEILKSINTILKERKYLKK